MENYIVVLERKCWSNELYSRLEYLKISGIPSDTEAGKLEETVLKVFEKLDVDFHSWKIATGSKLEIGQRKS